MENCHFGEPRTESEIEPAKCKVPQIKMDATNFKTPSRIPAQSRKLKNGNGSSLENSVSPITIPASPFMKKLGWGTGVMVYRLDREPTGSRPTYRNSPRSPWAVKKAKKIREEARKRLIFESEILRKLNHPNIVGFR